jgi:hypothetical protein
VAQVGQFFTIAAVVLGSLLIGVSLSTSSSFVDESQAATASYFDSAAQSASRAVDDALAGNDSAESIKRRLYRHHRMVELAAQRRGIDYRAKQLVVLPTRDEALYINYAPEPSRLELTAGGSSFRRQVDPRQSTTIGYGPATEIRVNITEQGVVERFNATQTRSLAFLQISTRDDSLRRTVLD